MKYFAVIALAQSVQVERFATLVRDINSPDELELVMVQAQWKRGANKIYDADGDGVEDNVKLSHFELDDFFWPKVFNSAEEINNTHHGNLPGHRQLEHDLV